MTRRLATLAVLLAGAALVLPRPAAAEPFLAVRTGLKCAVCHVNGTGGGMRTAFGTNYSQTILPRKIQITNGRRTVFDPGFANDVKVGGDLRLQNRSVLQPGEDANQFEFTEGNLYAEIVMVPDFLSFYVDEAVAPAGASGREAFVLLQHTERQLFLKAGRILLPFGTRLWDDDAFIRRVTGFHFAAQDLGVELAWRPGRASAAIAVTNGTGSGPDNNREKQVSIVLSHVYDRFRFGGSFSTNQAPLTQRTAGGVFAGARIGSLTLLGEFDVISDDYNGDVQVNHGDSRLAYVEANLLVAKGVNVKFAYDWFDPFTDVDEDEREMYRVGVEPFLTQFLQVRAFYRHRKAPPQLEAENADWLTTELHVFF
ncbi:hypothetical protein K8I85_19470 [bacterium]|nr:hypothetical protein [bacterium]